MRNRPRLSRYERREVHEEKLKNDMGGTGVYIYENNTDADLKLPKPTGSGIRTVGPRKRFQGDSYFLSWVGNPMNLLKLIEEVVPKMTFQELQDHRAAQDQLLEEEAMANEKRLVLDQPDCITQHGKVERVVVEPQQALNDNTDRNQKKPEVLLNENPLDGVEIILG